METLPVASCCGNLDKLPPDGPLGPNADFTFYRTPQPQEIIPSVGEYGYFLELHNDEKVASSLTHTHIKARVQNDHNGQVLLKSIPIL